jgi:pimeloyl-ACP methyl ester carboxylesterase
MILQATGRGTGSPVILLHGLFGRSQNFGTLMRQLAAGFRVIAIDLRNHGASPHVAGMSYPAMADDVLETIATLGVERAAVLGHSMGGKVAMLAALRRPAAVSRLIVADIAPVAYRHANAGVAAAMLALPLVPGLSRSDADAQLAEAVPDPAVRSFLLQNLSFGAQPAWRIGLAEIAADMRLIEGFPDIAPGTRYDGPTLFIRGGRSGYVKESARPAIAALFPAARVETLDDAGHWLHADQPEAFAALVAAFLREGP